MYSLITMGKARILTLLFSLQLLCLFANAQTKYSGSAVDLLINGTSTLHDWTMRSIKAECTALFEFNAKGQISAISSLTFSTPVNALKSEHTAMDNNAYKALKKRQRSRNHLHADIDNHNAGRRRRQHRDLYRNANHRRSHPPDTGHSPLQTQSR